MTTLPFDSSPKKPSFQISIISAFNVRLSARFRQIRNHNSDSFDPNEKSREGARRPHSSLAMMWRSESQRNEDEEV